MPRFNLNLNGVDVEAAEGFDQWSGPTPPRGSYPARLKVCKIVGIKGKEGQHRMSIMATIDTEKDDDLSQYHGCPAWGGANLSDEGLPYVNQFLQAISKDDAQFKKVKTAFYGAGPVTDEKKTNITKIADVKVDSPNGELPILITVAPDTYNGSTNVKIKSFLPKGSEIDGGGSSDDEEAVEEDDVEEDDSDDDSDSDDSAEDDGEEAADESIFDEESEDASA
jgi:hypothetical protein